MDKCEHIWLYIGSKRQQVWRCTRCDEYRIDDPFQKREWVWLTDDEIESEWLDALSIKGKTFIPFIHFARVIEGISKEKNHG